MEDDLIKIVLGEDSTMLFVYPKYPADLPFTCESSNINAVYIKSNEIIMSECLSLFLDTALTEKCYKCKPTKEEIIIYKKHVLGKKIKEYC